MYITAVISTLAAWFLGLFLDVNIDFGDPRGMLCLRVIFPIIVMGIFILRSNSKKNETTK